MSTFSENYTISSTVIRNQFKDYYKTIQSLAIDTMYTADRKYWLCDGIYPQYFGKGKLSLRPI